MRILHLISSNGLYGAERVLLNLAVGMNFNDAKVWIVGIRNSHNPHLELINEAKKRNIPTGIIESKSKFDSGAVNELAALIKENKIDLIHTHNYKADFIGMAAARKVKVPIVATLHGYIGKGVKLRFYEFVDKLTLRSFDKIVAVDYKQGEILKRRYRQVTVINNGVQLPLNTPVKSSVENMAVGTVGRLSEEKGFPYLLQAFAKVKSEFPQIKLVVVGDGPLKVSLKNLTSSLRLDGFVEFAGFQPDVTRYYQDFNLYVSSSLLEHFPMSILEAMSYGKAIVATNVGGTTDLIKDGETGILIRPASVDDLYVALKKVISNAALRKKLGENAQVFVRENYSIEKMVKSYRQIYEEVLEKR